MTHPFLAFVARLQHDNQFPRKTPQKDDVTQLDLFKDENESLADRIGDLIVRDFIVSMHEAGADLATLKIQVAINAARERTIDTLKSAFRAMRRNAAETQ
jgi:hypothetical protein